ncbi:Glutamine-dependent NAD(+) synthetase [Beauveria bassiana]|nr:Glutamine-dependent NAD(+) synthetase [Beauveria bassiana]
MGRCVTVAACSLRQWALDFEGNTDRIIESTRRAKADGARLRVGPELEISGYSCNDHFLEPDLYLHCLEMLARILQDKTCHGILLDIGLPVTHRNVNYNCRVVCLDGKILFIRPKMHYREMRYFTPWLRPTHWEEFHLPKFLQKLQGSTHVPFGDCVISTPDSCFGAETCEEMWSPDAPRGDGDRLYFDGSAMVFCNGQVLAQSPQFSLNDVDVVTATVDLEEVRAYRSSISRAMQAAQNTRKYYRIQTSFELSPDEDDFDFRRPPTLPREPKFYSVEEEIALSPQELCHRILHTVYMGMSKQSSRETRQRAKDLSAAIGSYHINLDIDSVYHAQKSLVKSSLGLDAKFKVEGGSEAENLMLQNIQARTRMVVAYEFAQILPTTRELAGGGTLLVLGSANVGEDINPIGSIDKAALRGFIAWAQVKFDMPCLEDFLTATPTAELEPVTAEYTQSDEADMGITYAELTAFGRLRKERKMGPLSMWQHLVHIWGKDRVKGPDDQNPSLEPAEIAEKVKFFFAQYQC